MQQLASAAWQRLRHVSAHTRSAIADRVRPAARRIHRAGSTVSARLAHLARPTIQDAHRVFLVAGHAAGRALRTATSPRWRHARAAVATVLTVATLSLTWQPNATWAGTVQTTDQAVGTCHAFETAAEQYSFSDVRPAVPCNQPHQSETAAVGELTGELADSKVRMTPEKRLMVVNDLCREPAREYIGAGPRDEVWGVDVMLRLPTEREWQRGVRRYRCELMPKSTTDSSRQLTVTDSMRDMFTEPTGATFRRCWTDLTTEVSCDKPHRSESVNSIAPVPAERFAGRPADLTAEQRAEFQRWAAPICGPTVSEFLEQPVATTPYSTEAHLTKDGRVIECSVALPDEQSLTSGSIAPNSQGEDI